MKLRWILVALIALATTPSFADSQARIVRLSFIDGDVEIDRAIKHGLERAILNLPVTSGARLQTGDDGAAEVEFEDGSTVRLAPQSEVYFEQLALFGTGGKVNSLQVENGLVYLNFRSNDDDDIRIRAGSRVFRIQDRARVRIDATRQRVQLAVLSGRVSLAADDGSQVTVKKDETLTLDLEDTGRYFLAKGIQEDSWDQWDKERDRYHAEKREVRVIYASSPYVYGWSDLDHYGNFSYVNGYGYVWRPYGVSLGWSPYTNGAWVWYPGHGYVWVSSHPWGWTPYRYGRWVYVRGPGWVWQPGYWSSWHRVVPVYNAPPHYRLPRPPRYNRTIPPTNPVVWVGNPPPRPPRRDPGDRFGGRRPVNPGTGVASHPPSGGQGGRDPKGPPTDRDVSGRRPVSPRDEQTAGATPEQSRPRPVYRDVSGRKPVSPVERPTPENKTSGESPEQGRPRPVYRDVSGRNPVSPVERPTPENKTPENKTSGESPEQSRPRPVYRDLSGRQPVSPAERPDRDGQTGRVPHQEDAAAQPRPRAADVPVRPPSSPQVRPPAPPARPSSPPTQPPSGVSRPPAPPSGGSNPGMGSNPVPGASGGARQGPSGSVGGQRNSPPQSPPRQVPSRSGPQL